MAASTKLLYRCPVAQFYFILFYPPPHARDGKETGTMCMRQNLPAYIFYYHKYYHLEIWFVVERNATPPLPQLTINNISVVAFHCRFPAIIAFLITDVIILSRVTGPFVTSVSPVHFNVSFFRLYTPPDPSLHFHSYEFFPLKKKKRKSKK